MNGCFQTILVKRNSWLSESTKWYFSRRVKIRIVSSPTDRPIKKSQRCCLSVFKSINADKSFELLTIYVDFWILLVFTHLPLCYFFLFANFLFHFHNRDTDSNGFPQSDSPHWLQMICILFKSLLQNKHGCISSTVVNPAEVTLNATSINADGPQACTDRSRSLYRDAAGESQTIVSGVNQTRRHTACFWICVKAGARN